ncbi:hypothetical protein D3C87_1913290 [compost metagenome]
MLTDAGLGDAELGSNDRHNFSRGVLALGQQLQNTAANRITQDVESVHQDSNGGSPE